MGIWSKKHLPQDLENAFPYLRKELYHITGKATDRYNCIAFAAGDNRKWWWPDPYGEYHWPRNAPREQTVDAFVKMFGLFGYNECVTPSLEVGLEKVAIYFDPFGTVYMAAGTPTHAAKQLTSGHWKSKLGPWQQIEHYTLECLNGKDPAYGEPIKFLAKTRTPLIMALFNAVIGIFWREGIEQGTQLKFATFFKSVLI
jgi:hypothetical protein